MSRIWWFQERRSNKVTSVNKPWIFLFSLPTIIILHLDPSFQHLQCQHQQFQEHHPGPPLEQYSSHRSHAEKWNQNQNQLPQRLCQQQNRRAYQPAVQRRGWRWRGRCCSCSCPRSCNERRHIYWIPHFLKRIKAWKLNEKCLVDSNCTIFYVHSCWRDKNPFLSSFIKLATVSERQAPPIHARPRLLAWHE